MSNYTVIFTCAEYSASSVSFCVESESKEDATRKAEKEIAYLVYGHGAERTEKTLEECVNELRNDEELKFQTFIFAGLPVYTCKLN